MHFIDALSQYIWYISFRDIMFYFTFIINPNVTLLCKKDTRLHNKATTVVINQCDLELIAHLSYDIICIFYIISHYYFYIMI